MERVAGIEPAYAAWEATVLPLNYTRLSNSCRGRLAPRQHCMPEYPHQRSGSKAVLSDRGDIRVKLAHSGPQSGP